MSQYIIKSDDGNLNIQNVDNLTVGDCFNVPFSDITGTSSDPDPKWESGNMYARFYKIGTNAGIAIKDYVGDTGIIGVASPDYTVIASFIKVEDGVEHLYIAINTGTDGMDAVSRIKSETGNYYLYSGLLEDAINDGVAEENTDWEDNPEDYNPDESQGGANADVAPINSDDMDDGFLVPYEPLADETILDHGDVRMMQPYLLTQSQFLKFGQFLWLDASQSSSSWHQILSTIFEGSTDPLSAIAGCIRLPISAGNISILDAGGAVPIYLGGVHVTGAFGEWINRRYVRMQYGLRLKEVFGTYYDYTQTSIQLYLPYVATVPLDASEVMDSNLRVTYLVDVFTGDLICTLNCNKTVYGKNLNSIIGRWKGNCALNEIYARANTQQHAQNIVNGAFGIVGSAIGGNALGAIGGALNMAMDQRIKTESGGNCSGASGWCDLQVPYLIIKRNIPLYPDEWRKIKGAEQHATMYVSQLSGYTEFDEIHIHVAMGATDEEKAEIENILKSGVII